ncbi:MAG: DegT/DnrJ/EryC1/StrS family aminotransferase [Rhodocyclales bacterium]|nr:DegT/DnrJ/EryC1/StrS family aminotransferase [Rhodocyclales bacterium]
MIPRRRIDIGLQDAADLWHGMRESVTSASGQVREFEAAASALLGGVPVRATASGRDALDLILAGLGIGPGDELVIPAYTLGELVARLRARGLKPVAADVDVDSFCLTPESVARAITPRTRAVVALHTFGAPCDIRGIAAVAARHGVPLIEDCAHAFGARIDGQPAGSVGRAALFSLEVAKPVAAFGGGLLASADAQLLAVAAEQLEMRRHSPWPATRKTLMKCAEEFAVRSPAYALAARMMFREMPSGGFESFYRGLHDRVRPADVAFGGFQARRGLRRLQGLAARNRHLNGLWEQLAASLPRGFVAQQRRRHGDPAAYNFVARHAGDLSRLRRRAQAAGLDLAIHGEILDDVAPMLGQTDCPGAAQVFAEAVAIPLHLGIDEAGLQRIGEILAGVVAP